MLRPCQPIATPSRASLLNKRDHAALVDAVYDGRVEVPFEEAPGADQGDALGGARGA